MTTATATTAAKRAVPGLHDAIAALPYRLRYESPFGPLLVAGDDEALTHLLLPGAVGTLTSTARLDGPVQRAARQLDEYFAGRRQQFDLPLAPPGTPFRQRVWQELTTIPYGQTITYAELAIKADKPGAFRAVGQANGANPIAIIVPCHRVIAAGGGLGGYGGGLELKQGLLDLERYSAASMSGNGSARAERPASSSTEKTGAKSRSVRAAAAS
jgi:methylated-DNA-[protein]-cysteine S-methyltransferase